MPTRERLDELVARLAVGVKPWALRMKRIRVLRDASEQRTLVRLVSSVEAIEPNLSVVPIRTCRSAGRQIARLGHDSSVPDDSDIRHGLNGFEQLTKSLSSARPGSGVRDFGGGPTLRRRGCSEVSWVVLEPSEPSTTGVELPARGTQSLSVDRSRHHVAARSSATRTSVYRATSGSSSPT